jgi:hypothetical protein
MRAPISIAVQYMAAIKRPVTVIGTSLGTIRAAQGIARSRPDALVLTSGFQPESAAVKMSIDRHRRVAALVTTQPGCRRATLPAASIPSNGQLSSAHRMAAASEAAM